MVNVYLPESYETWAQAEYLSYTFLDGGEREDFLHIAALAQINAAYGQGQELIVVGVEGVDHRHDLTSPSAVAADRKSAPTSGGAASYRQFLIEELKPLGWPLAHYRTHRSERAHEVSHSLACSCLRQCSTDRTKLLRTYHFLDQSQVSGGMMGIWFTLPRGTSGLRPVPPDSRGLGFG